MLHGFKQFILRGNVVDLAVGVVVGAAFGNIVNALVKDILTPLVGAIIKVPDFSNLKFTLRGSDFMYGDFLNSFISFLIISTTIYFFVVLPINTLIEKTKHKEKAEEKATVPTTKKCPECLSNVPSAATRCAHCTISFS
jgi:large conductance mechanosensitive channel